MTNALCDVRGPRERSPPRGLATAQLPRKMDLLPILLFRIFRAMPVPDRICLAAVLLLAYLLGASGAATANATLPITIAYEDTALPPFYLGESSQVPERLPGISVEILQRLDAEWDAVAFEFRRMPWSRCQHALRHGAVDAIFPASFKPARLEIGVYPMRNGTLHTAAAMVSLSYYFYTLPEHGLRYDGAALHGSQGTSAITASAPMGYSVVSNLREMGLAVEESGGTLSNLQKLVHRRVQAVALQDITVEAIQANDSRFDGIIRLEPAVRTAENYLLFSHQFMAAHPETAAIIWDKLATLVRELTPVIAARYQQQG